MASGQTDEWNRKGEEKYYLVEFDLGLAPESSPWQLLRWHTHVRSIERFNVLSIQLKVLEQ